mgnify:CR=1 FL=1
MGLILGIDEVGRGCWAGPLVAGAVVLSSDFLPDTTLGVWKLGDSKKLSKKQRDLADVGIRSQALAYALGWVSPEEVDSLGLTKAVRLAMQRAVEQIKHAYEQIIIDGDYNFLHDHPLANTVVKADSLIPSVSAASIIAKVARDNYMTQLALEYPGFGFESHVGYGTKLHKDALEHFGTTPHHRMSYKPIRKIVDNYR